MKYEWLVPYVSIFQNVTKETFQEESFQKQLQSFFLDCEYYLSYLAYTKERFEMLRDRDVASLNDAELEVYLYSVLTDCRINDTLEDCILDGTIPSVLEAMLKVPDTSLPVSDYTFSEVLEEIANLHIVLPTKDKVSHNNVGACYSCHNVFYVDLIHHMSKDHLCLCPYCLSATIYFDNDYIPMNSSFIRLAMLYYQTDIPFADLVSALLSKVVVRSKPYKHHFVQVDISNDEFVKELSDYKIYVSTTSACCTSDRGSIVLNEINNNDQRISQTSIRISISHLTTEKEITTFLSYFNIIWNRLNK